MTFFLYDTRQKIFWDEVLETYVPKSRLGQSLWKQMKPYTVENKEEWKKEINQILLLSHTIQNNKVISLELDQLFTSFDDIRESLHFLNNNELKDYQSLKEFFLIKRFLIFSYSLSKVIKENIKLSDDISEKIIGWYEYAKKPWKSWIKLLEPNNREYNNHFSVQDIDDDALANLRIIKRLNLKKEQKYKKLFRTNMEKAYGVFINIEGYVVLPLNDQRVFSLSKSDFFDFVRYQGEDIVYMLKLSNKELEIKREIEKVDELIKKEEKRRCQEVINQLKPYMSIWIDAHMVWGRFEIIYQKAKMAAELGLTKPTLNQDETASKIIIKNGLHPYLNRLWKEQDKKMEPITINLNIGITMLYGGNMSGKTIALRTVGLILALSQYGFFVPAEYFQFSFFEHISLFTGEYQDVEKGLSSFAAEIVRLADELSINNRTLFLYDEIGSGTNPIEGEALLFGLTKYLKEKKDSVTMIVSHYPKIIQEDYLFLYEVKNYKLYRREKGKMVTEAISVAKQLGLPEKVIGYAELFLKENGRGELYGKTKS